MGVFRNKLERAERVEREVVPRALSTESRQ